MSRHAARETWQTEIARRGLAITMDESPATVKGSKGRYGFSASETWPEAPLATAF
jgi:hypothetical protein